jgi:hypothetical protein
MLRQDRALCAESQYVVAADELAGLGGNGPHCRHQGANVAFAVLVRLKMDVVVHCHFSHLIR